MDMTYSLGGRSLVRHSPPAPAQGLQPLKYSSRPILLDTSGLIKRTGANRKTNRVGENKRQQKLRVGYKAEPNAYPKGLAALLFRRARTNASSDAPAAQNATMPMILTRAPLLPRQRRRR